MLQVIGDFLPSAVAVALSPIPIVAVVVVLTGSSSPWTGVTFAFGWVVGLLAVTTVVLLVASGADDANSGTSTVVDVLQVIIGAAFLVLAAKKWRGRPRPGESPEMPGWMATLASVTPARSLLLGAALSGANPKNLALAASAAGSIAQAGLGGSDVAIAAGAFVVLGSVAVVGAVLADLVAGDRAAPPLAEIKRFMADNNAVIMMTVLLVLGAKILGDGLAGLSD